MSIHYPHNPQETERKQPIKQVTLFINICKWLFIPKTYEPVGINGDTYKWLCFELLIQRDYDN